MNHRTQLALAAVVILAAGVGSALLCPPGTPVGNLCLAGSLWVSAAAVVFRQIGARAKSRLVCVGAQVVGGLYGALGLLGGWAVARLLPESLLALAMFHLLCLAGAAVCLFVLASTAQGIRRGRELEAQFPSNWGPLFEKAGACLMNAEERERQALEGLCAALRKAEAEGRRQEDFEDVLEQLETAMKKTADLSRASRIQALCEEACWMAGLNGLDPTGE